MTTRKVSEASLVSQRALRSLGLVCLGIILWACSAGAPPLDSYPQSRHDTQPEPPLEAAIGAPAPVLTAAVDPSAVDLASPANGSAAARTLAAFPVFTDPGELPSMVVASTGPTKGERTKLPLKETRVTAKLSEFVAEVEVTQRYENPNDRAIEAVYVFPLPENAAVNRMKMTVGERVIEATIDERTNARRSYEQAKQKGFTAALLEQERPNVFTQSVANIAPGKAIEVTVRYVQDLSYDAGIYEFVFPMVVGPRFMAGAPLDGPQTGTGTAADTTVVPDASRISPPYVGKGQRSGHDIRIEVIADPALAVSEYQAVTHEVQSKKDESGLLHLVLSPKDSVPNRDYVLRYRVAGEKPSATMMLGGADSGFFSLAINPPDLAIDELVGNREIVFVVDISGSMRGVPMALCKEAMRTALSKVRPVDTFNVITFAGNTAKVFQTARPANDANVRLALDFIDRMRAGGGTMMLDAVTTALSPDVEKGRGRYVFFLTDGYVGGEDQIMQSTRAFVSAMEKKGQRARVFGFGVGSSTNRALIDGLSQEGKGVAVYATNREDPARGVNRFFRYIDKSVLRDVSIDWGGAKVSEATPAELPDLFASHPLIVHGRFSGKGSRAPVIHATSATGPIEIPVQVVAAKKGDKRDVLGILWARSKVGSLELDLASGDANAKAAITKLGLDFSLVTRFTSFVAVDGSRTVGDGAPEQVVQAVDQPEGVKLKETGGQGLDNWAVGGRGGNPGAEGDKDGSPTPDAPPTSMQREASAPPGPYLRGKSGCACTTEPTGNGAGAKLAFVLSALVALARRRKRRSPDAL